MIHPSRRSVLLAGAGLVFALVPVLVTPAAWTAWVGFWLCLVLAQGLDAVLAVRPRAWKADLQMPGVLAVGSPRPTELHLTTGRRGAVRTEVRVELTGPLDPLPILVARGTGGEAKVTLSLRAARRGQVGIRGIWLRYDGPFGLTTRIHHVPLDLSAAAAPDLGPVHRAAIRFQSDRGREGLKIERYLGEGSDFDSLREFLPGHDTRAIDWKASARHTRLLVRKFRAERNHRIILAVDCSRLMSEPIEGTTRLDHSIHAALVLAYVGLRSGDQVGLYAFDSRPRLFVAPLSGASAFPTLVRRSGEIAYAPEEPNYTLALTDLSSRLTRRSLVITFTDFADSIAAELMLENLDRLARRHLTLFVTPRDPFLTELVHRPPSTLGDLNRAVVAGGLLRERQTILRRLKRMGVLRVEAPPAAIGAELVNRYLEIKRRERI